MRRIPPMILTLILFISCAAFGSPGNTQGGIRDIHGAVAPPARPPVAAPLAVLAFAATGGLYLRRRRSPPADPPLDTVAARLFALRAAYQKGEVTAESVFEELPPLVRSLCAAEDNPALTSGEVVLGAKGSLPETVLEAAETVLQLCDGVRFGAAAVDSAMASRALDAAVAAAVGAAEGAP